MTYTFAKYGRAGFGPSILPVIPPGAPLSARTKMTPDKLGKTPGKLLADGFVGLRGWQLHITTDEDLALWDKWRERPHGCNVGLRGDDFPSLDLDVNDADLSARLARVVLRIAGPAPVRRVIADDTETPGARCLLVYRGGVLTSWTTRFMYDGAEHMVELKGSRRQCVIEGRHRSGGRYEWDTGSSLLDYGAGGLTELLASTAAHLRAALEAEIEAAGGTIIDRHRADVVNGAPRDPHRRGEPAPSVADVRAALNAAPNSEEVDRAEWVAVARYIKGACQLFEAEGREAFLDWSEGYEGNTPDACLELWGSLRPPHHTGWFELAMWAQRRSEGRFSAAAYDFDAVAIVQGPVDELFARHIWVERQEAIFDRQDLRLRTRGMFDPFCANMGPVWAKEKTTPWQFFLREPDQPSPMTPIARRQTVLDITYRPGAALIYCDGRASFINRWRAPEGIPDGPVADDDIRLWLDHVGLILPDETERRNLLGWMASVAQRPAEKPNHGVVLGGVHGIGKSLLFNVLKTAVGRPNVKEITVRDLDAEFSDWMGECKVFFVEEMMNFGKKELMQRIKTLLAAPPDTLQVNPKYGRKYEVPNLLAGVFFTNHEDAVALEKGERRFAVYWSEAKKESPEYFKRLANWLREGGDKLAARWLLDYDASYYNMLGEAPATAARESMRHASRSKLDEWIEDGIENGTGCFASDLVALDDVRARVPFDVVGRYGGPNAAGFAGSMRRAGARSVGRRFLGAAPAGCSTPQCDTSQARLYSLRRHEMFADLDNQKQVELFWELRRRAERTQPGFVADFDPITGEVR